MYKNWPQNNGYHTTYRPVSTNGSYYGGYAYRPENKEIRPSLRDLIGRLDEYDNLRLELELHGGRIGQLNALTRLLREPLNVLVNGQSREVRLVDQASLRSAITSLDSDLHLQIRLKPSHMPAYYLCRTKTDYWAEYSLIVEDYYQSPGYPLTDSRFGRLMRAGHEQDFLRLSRFRESVAMLLSLDGGSADDYAVDEKLHLLGRHVFQAAWHRDQEVGVAFTRHFNVPELGQAVELLYLCLSGDLCQMRSVTDAFLLEFFRETYPQPAIADLLEALPAMTGEMLTELPRLAQTQYAKLSKAFSRFLSIDVPWKAGAAPLPLWKIVYANIGRLNVVGPLLRETSGLKVGLEELGSTAKDVMACLLDWKN